MMDKTATELLQEDGPTRLDVVREKLRSIGNVAHNMAHGWDAKPQEQFERIREWADEALDLLRTS
jgi:hypothetical protein